MLRVQRLISGYQQLQVLHGLSFHIAQGEIVAFIGNNGVGKTTMLNVLSGQIAPWQGKILYQGDEIHRTSTQQRCKKGLFLLPEGGGCFRELSVLENIKLGWAINKTLSFSKQLDEVLDLFPDLKPKLAASAGDLSGGQRQMLAFSIALAAKPELLMIDEPSIGLSPVIFQDLLAKVVELKKEKGMTFLIVEQNVRKILSCSDRAYVMNQGKIVMSGESEKLLNDSKIQSIYMGGGA